jgi:hypothetical protein
MHARKRRIFRRDLCTCGVPWPCNDAKLADVRERYAKVASPPMWSNWPTDVYWKPRPVTPRLNRLTTGQAQRTNASGRHGA